MSRSFHSIQSDGFVSASHNAAASGQAVKKSGAVQARPKLPLAAVLVGPSPSSKDTRTGWTSSRCERPYLQHRFRDFHWIPAPRRNRNRAGVRMAHPVCRSAHRRRYRHCGAILVSGNPGMNRRLTYRVGRRSGVAGVGICSSRHNGLRPSSTGLRICCSVRTALSRSSCSLLAGVNGNGCGK